MTKKLSLLFVSIAMVVFAVPSIAGAAPTITDPPGTLLAVGAKIEATNIGAVTVDTSLGKTSCNTWDMTAEITANTGTTFKGVGVGQGKTSMCSKGTKPVTITDITVSELHSAAVGSGTMNLTFVDHVQSVTCHFEAAKLPFTYTSGSDVIKITNGDLKGDKPVCEPGLMNAQFTIETDGGGAVVLD